MGRVIRTAAAALLMILAVMAATVAAGQAEAERCGETEETDCRDPAIHAKTEGETDSHVGPEALLGMTGKTEETAEKVEYDSAEPEPAEGTDSRVGPEAIPGMTGETDCHGPAALAMTGEPDEEYILQVITAEGGTDQLICNGVVQCLYNACRRDGWAHSVTEILREYQYTGPAGWVSEEARNAWDAVFLSGVTYVDFGGALYFYAPRYCESPWHESQRFVIEINGIRFFERWD